MAPLARIAGWTLIVLGVAVLLLPGPLGWPGLPLVAGGSILVLRGSTAAKRRLLGLARAQPATFGRLRRLLGRRARRRRAAAR